MSGVKQESGGVIRHGAKLLHALADARVAKITVVLRQAYGGAYIAMNSKGLGADLVYVWPRAVIGIMGATQAVGIIHRRELRAASDRGAQRERLAAHYAAEHQGTWVAAREGAIDEVIPPAETRPRLVSALEALAEKPRAA